MKDIGELLMFGFEGTVMTSELERFIKDTSLGGMILFKRNIVDPQQVKKLIEDIKNAAQKPLMIGVDQEGGRVVRLITPFTKLPSMAKVGLAASKDPDIAKKMGALIAREISAVGFNLDFAPVLDVATNPDNPVIGDRAFSSDAGVVAKLAAEFIDGMQNENVAACGKHFPGHGDTNVDSHLGLPVVEHKRARFEACEFIPFRAAIKAGVASMMTAHLKIPSLDTDRPVTTSKKITTGILREEFGFDGIIFTDDLTMKGSADIMPPEEAVWQAIDAGADVAMVCHNIETQLLSFKSLADKIREKGLSEKRVEASLERIKKFKKRFSSPDIKRPSMDVIGCREHELVVDSLSPCGRGLGRGG